MTVDINRPDEDTMWKLLKENPGNAVGAILRLSWLQGMTREEICSLTWGDIYTEKKIIALKDREIPLNDDTQQCLHLRITASSNMSPYLCDPRPDRGHDAGRSDRDHEGRCDPADRHATGGL